MQMTERDGEILRFINEFGFCEMPHVESKFGMKTSRSYKVMRRLIDAGLVVHERILYKRHGALYLTKKGAKYTELPALVKVPIGIYEHQVAIIQAYFTLMSKYPDALWVSERSMKHEKFKNGLGKRGHVADGMLAFCDARKKIAIEIELTAKGEDRLKGIMYGYLSKFDIEEVWYFCDKSILAWYTKLAAKLPHVKIYPVEELMDGE